MSALSTYVAPNPLDLYELLHDYCVEELGEIFIYLPMPHEESEVWACFETIRILGAIKGGPWTIHIDSVRPMVRRNRPRLFVGNPIQFKVYRLNREKLRTLFE